MTKTVSDGCDRGVEACRAGMSGRRSAARYVVIAVRVGADPPGDLVGRGRHPEEPPLGGVALQFADEGGLIGGLDALGRHREPEGVRQRDDRRDDLVVGPVAARCRLQEN